ncbi:hypothetical protein JCM10212_006803 [Sporobolomyces blumeae]
MADSLPTPADSPQVVASFEPLTHKPATAAAAAAPTEDRLAQGARALALSKYAEACESLAFALESLTEQYGEMAKESVDALILYGKALLGSAIAQSAVLGDKGPSAPALPENPNGATSTSSNATAGPSNAAFHFGGDAEDEEEEDAGQGQDGDEDGEGAEGDPEDDFEQAFTMLDMARKIIEEEVDEIEKEIREGSEGEKGANDAKRKERKEKLAEVHRLLGDVETENERFESAVEEYSSSLSILTRTRSPSDRILAEQHMLIALALEFIPSSTGRAVSHAEKAKGVLILKLDELEKKEDKSDKDKREIEDIKGLLGDVDNKIEDLKTIPTAPEPSASDLALEQFLRQATGVGASSAGPAPVNDLTSLVKKKKKVEPTAEPSTQTTPSVKSDVKVEDPADADGKGKRKAEDEMEKEGGELSEKKVKVDDAAP